MNVLLVDDDFIDRTVLERWCKKQNYHFVSCENGKEALQTLMHKDFDLLISDLDMPVLGGIGLIKEVRENNICIPSIAISANEDCLIKQQAINSGFNYFIPKQMDYSTLSALITDTVISNIKH